MDILGVDDPLAASVTLAIQGGDVTSLQRLLDAHGGLATARLVSRRNSTRTLLHVVTDWPGYFPGGPESTAILVAAGADPNAVIVGGRFPETPLHSTASSDDADVADVLIAAGADLVAPDGCIGTPLDNAVAFGCWQVARRLVAAGAPVDALWHAAGLGMAARMEELLEADPVPTPTEISEAFWQACHGGQRRAAERLLRAGADLNFTPGFSDETSPFDASSGHDTQRENLIEWLVSRGAESAPPKEPPPPG
jgi:ankyrin repeat protein